MKLSANDKIILNRLNRSSYNKPVKLLELCRLTKLEEREVKESIGLLRMYFGIPVVSFRRFGYFIPKTEEERRKGTSAYRKQIKTETETLIAILKAELNEIPEKIEQFLSEE